MAKSKNEVYDDSFCSTSCRKNTEDLNTKITILNETLSDSKTNLYHYKLALSQVEARLVEFKTQEIKFCEKIRGLKFDVKNKNNKIERLTNELEHLKKEKEGLESKLTGFESASKDLDNLLGSQRYDKNKEGLGYSVVSPLLLKSTLLQRKICLGLDCLNLLMTLLLTVSLGMMAPDMYVDVTSVWVCLIWMLACGVIALIHTIFFVVWVVMKMSKRKMPEIVKTRDNVVAEVL
nr:ankyrin repeat-containing protein ITN1-like [Tanacetum cinerariifolium]